MVNTVLGPIAPSSLGVTLCHEHIFVGSTDLSKAFGDRWYDKEKLVDIAVKQLSFAREKFGLSTMIDGTPPDLGRDIDLLVKVSRLSGVNIIASTGFYYDDRCYIKNKSPEFLADFFINECRFGSENTYKTSTPVLPGMLKCATGVSGITPINATYLKTMAIVQRKTSLPLFVHCSHSVKTAPAQLDLLLESGADASKIIIGHTSDSDDIEYLTSILERGVYIGFDRLYGFDSQAETLIKLLDLGYGDKILLSRDGDVHFDFSSGGFEESLSRSENKFTAVLDKFLTMLRQCGICEDLIRKMLIDNTIKLYE